MSFDYRRIRTGELIAGAGATVLFISMFLRWYDIGGNRRNLYLYLVGGHPHPLTGNAWQTFSNTAIVLLVLVVLALALGVVTATQQQVQLPLAGACTALAFLCLALLLYRVFGHRPGGNTYTKAALGAYLGLLATIVILLGAVMTAREDRGRLHSADKPLDRPAGEDVAPAPPGEPT